jgi:large subunit ribosomal protein L22
MNTAARDRALLPTVKEVLGRTPVTKLKLTKEKDGSLKVLLHTSRPNNVRMETTALTQALKEQIGKDRSVTLQVVPEARAVAKYVRTSPRKARLVIDAIKGKRVAEAIAALRFIPNHAAELISKVLISAAANAQDGWGAGVEELKIVNILADGGPSLKRVRARAQGRAYRILKRTSHLTVILTEAPLPVRPSRTASAPAKPKVVKAPAVPKAENVQAAAPVVEATPPEVVTPVAEADAPEVEAAPVTPPEAQPEEATPVTASDAPEEDGGVPDLEQPTSSEED